MIMSELPQFATHCAMRAGTEARPTPLLPWSLDFEFKHNLMRKRIPRCTQVGKTMAENPTQRSICTSGHPGLDHAGIAVLPSAGHLYGQRNPNLCTRAHHTGICF